MPYYRMPSFFAGCCALTRSWRARRERRDVRAAVSCTAPTIPESLGDARRNCTPSLIRASASAATVVVVGRRRCRYVSWAGASIWRCWWCWVFFSLAGGNQMGGGVWRTWVFRAGPLWSGAEPRGGETFDDAGDSAADPGALAPMVARSVPAEHALASRWCALYAADHGALSDQFAGTFCRRHRRSHGASPPLSDADHGPANRVAWGSLIFRRGCG